MRLKVIPWLAALVVASGLPAPTVDALSSNSFPLPGTIGPTACRVGAVLSTEQFTTTGFSSVRYVGPDGEAVAGAWVVADNRVPDTGVVDAPHCPADADRVDNRDLNLMGVRITPTAGGVDHADIERVKLVQDVNLNGTYEPGIDLTLQVQPGEALTRPQGAVFQNAPHVPLLRLADNGVTCTLLTLHAGQGDAAVLFSDGNSVIAGEYEVGSTITAFVTVVDGSANENGAVRETVRVDLSSDITGDTLTDVPLLETAPDSGVFRGPFTLGDPGSTGDDVLTAQDGDTIEVSHQGTTDDAFVDVGGNDAVNAPDAFDKVQLYIDVDDNGTFDPNVDRPATAVTPGEAFFLVVFDSTVSPGGDDLSDLIVLNPDNRDAEELDEPPADFDVVSGGEILVGAATAPLPTAVGPPTQADGVLQADRGRELNVTANGSNRFVDTAGDVEAATVVATQVGNMPCAVGLLAVVEIGDEPQTGTRLGLQMEAVSGNVPSVPPGRNAAPISSGFADSRNPQASNLRLMILGGEAESATPITHLSNASGSPESAVAPIEFAGDGLKTRFREPHVTPGAREAVAIAVGVCDGAQLANTSASLLPPSAGAPPTIAGGLGAIPCVNGAGADALLTGINGAVVAFTGPGARHMGTVRMYVDEDADGVLFEPGELVAQQTPIYNRPTAESIAVFGGNAGQILTTGNGTPVAGGAVICTAAVCTPTTPGVGIGFRGGTNNATGPEPANAPLLIVFTVDVDAGAPPGPIDVRLGLETFDDTDEGAFGPCPAAFGGRNCGSNFLERVPANRRFEIVPSAAAATTAELSAGEDGRIDDAEFLEALHAWTDGRLPERHFQGLMDAWIALTGVSSPTPRELHLQGVELSRTERGVQFHAQGQGIVKMDVRVFRLDGATVFESSADGRTLTWSPTDGDNSPVSNGVYLAQVSVRNADGRSVESQIRKVVVLR